MSGAISSNNYVSITSGVGGVPAVSGRSLDLRIISTSELIPTGGIIAFDGLALVADYFGTDSTEYARALLYFSYVSKQITKAKRISFARWANTDTSAQVFGSKAGSLADLKAFSEDSLTVTLGGVDATITPDLSSVDSYSAVASAIETAIQEEEGSFENTTVVYDATKTSFNLDTNGTADGSISITSDSADLLTALGWSSQAIFSDGVSAQTITEQLNEMTNISNDFGTYVFDDHLTLEQIKESAAFNDASNILYQYHVQITKDNAQSYYDDLNGYSGLGLTINETDGEYPEILPCAQLASQNFDSNNASTNYMYINHPLLSPQVSSDSEYAQFTSMNINFIGVTQESGAMIQFYQPGSLQGGLTAPHQMGVYANEQWLKSYLKSRFLNLFISLANFPVDNTGLSYGNSVIQSTADKALFNKTFSIGKPLTDTQKEFINSTAQDPQAISAIQDSGYWCQTYFSQETENGQLIDIYNYILIYATSTSVRKVEGRNMLI